MPLFRHLKSIGVCEQLFCVQASMKLYCVVLLFFLITRVDSRGRVFKVALREG